MCGCGFGNKAGELRVVVVVVVVVVVDVDVDVDDVRSEKPVHKKKKGADGCAFTKFRG